MGNDRIPHEEVSGSVTADILVTEFCEFIISVMLEISCDFCGVQCGEIDWTTAVRAFETSAMGDALSPFTAEIMSEDSYLFAIF